MTDRVELLEAALDSLPEGIAFAGLDGQVKFWNHAAEAITGYAAAQLLGHSVRELLDLLVIGGARQMDGSDRRGDAFRAADRWSSMRHRLGHELPVWCEFWCCGTDSAGASGQPSSFIPPRAWMRCRMGDCGEDRRRGGKPDGTRGQAGSGV